MSIARRWLFDLFHVCEPIAQGGNALLRRSVRADKSTLLARMQHNPKDPYHQQQCDAEDYESEHGGFFHLFFGERIPQRRDALIGPSGMIADQSATIA
jgi:hypothetical protein